MPVPPNPECRATTLGRGELSCIFVGRAADPRKRFDRVLDDVLQAAVSRAHWLVLTSEQEGFGFVVAEALACGTPVAST